MTELEQAIESWLAWFSCVDFTPYYNEFRVKGTRTQGTCDTVGLLHWPEKKIFHKVYYIDWKSSLYVNRNSHGPQIAAYKRYDGRFPDAGIAILHLSKEETDFKWVDYSKHENRMFDIYYHAEAMYFYKHPVLAKQFDHLTPF